MKARLTDIGLLWLRVLAGAGIMTHGYGKIFGGRMEKFAGGVGEMGFPMPLFFAWAAALSEFVGGLCLALGLGTRVAAFFIACTMSVAAFIRHAADPFGRKELALAYWTIAIALLILGGGRYAVERLLCRRASTR